VICHLSNARKCRQIQLILPELCDARATERIQRNFFPYLIITLLRKTVSL